MQQRNSATAKASQPIKLFAKCKHRGNSHSEVEDKRVAKSAVIR